MWHRSHNHSHFAKHFTKWLQLHQRSHFIRVATATAVLATAEALPKGPIIYGSARWFIVAFTILYMISLRQWRKSAADCRTYGSERYWFSCYTSSEFNNPLNKEQTRKTIHMLEKLFFWNNCWKKRIKMIQCDQTVTNLLEKVKTNTSTQKRKTCKHSMIKINHQSIKMLRWILL
jgi:hypothetical protein